MAATRTPEEKEAAAGRLTKTLHSAVVMGDSHGKHVRAAEILDGALERDSETATPAELLEALAYRAELALRADDPGTARKALDRARALTLSETERDKLADTLSGLDDLEAVLRLDA
jgi:predicted nucleic acid-binding protein